jgi:hypothetical protein
MKFGMHNFALQPISTAYFINSSNQSVPVKVYSLIVARQRLGKNVTAETNTSATIETLLDVSFPVVSVVSKETTYLVLPRTSCSFHKILQPTIYLVSIVNLGKNYV